MKPAVVAPAQAIRVNVTVPITRFGFGPFSLDPLEQMIGAKLADLLEPLMVGPVGRRPSATGPAVEVYPLALPDGEGASIPLGQWGEIGFRNLCRAKHKLRYAESASMRSWRPMMPCRRGSPTPATPHNDALAAGGDHA